MAETIASSGAPAHGVAPGPGVRFTAGSVFAGRYRIIGLLGRGGMGEVYRADDLTLNHPVALKFLPPALASSPERLERFLNEVRIARQISHPNVCRVYDIGESDGHYYLSMEYIDGEDLSSLLRRIGRLPRDKAIDIARQVCAGLAAAHKKSVLHRDLKPANVMLDGDGNARITDFGLATASAELDEREIRAGTPVYMAPEQLRGESVSVQSDIYSLGLVLHEVLTGQRLYDADSIDELSRLHSRPTELSTTSTGLDIDPLVEAVLHRCLDPDPTRRPESALAVAAALPGGDPLAAALAAGETPSPEAVAAADVIGRLSPAVAWSVFLVTLALLFLAGRSTEHTRVFTAFPDGKRHDVLVERARDLLAEAGIQPPVADERAGYRMSQTILLALGSADTRTSLRDSVARAVPAAVQFWYRSSPRPLVAEGGEGYVTINDPTMYWEGMTRVGLGLDGSLVGLECVADAVRDSSEGRALDAAARADLDARISRLFDAAGLDQSRFERGAPVLNPHLYCDALESWFEVGADSASARRVDVGTAGEGITFFDVVSPWSRPSRVVASLVPGRARLGLNIIVIVVLLVIVGAAYLVRRHHKLRRGDWRGASRLAVIASITSFASWALSAHHVSALTSEWGQITTAAGSALFLGGFVWVLYAALEPYVRREAPERIVAWSRALAGRHRDPLVGRSVLLGSLFGLIVYLLDAVHALLPQQLGLESSLPAYLASTQFSTMTSPGRTLAFLIGGFPTALINGFFFVVMPFILQVVVRKQWIAIGLLTLIMTIAFSLRLGVFGGNEIVAAVASFLQVSIWIGIMLRLGLLALVTQFFVYLTLTIGPTSLAFGAWHGASSMILMGVVALLTVYGFVVARGRAPGPPASAR